MSILFERVGGRREGNVFINVLKGCSTINVKSTGV